MPTLHEARGAAPDPFPGRERSWRVCGGEAPGRGGAMALSHDIV